MNKNRVTRRNFLQTTSTGAMTLGAMVASSNVVRAQPGPNDTIGVGHIGIGVRGGTLLTQVAGRQLGGGIPGTKVVAVCDVYGPHRDKGVQRSMNEEVKAYEDYKELLADPNVDAVVIATPDHWHARILQDAAKAGKDIYIEKGWTRSMDEAKAMRKAIKENDVIMQLGHQSRARTCGVQAADLINDGLLGDVTMVRTGRFENNPLGQNIWRWYGWYNRFERPDPEFVIENLNWEQWLSDQYEGRDFSMEHFWHWRCYWDYGTGIAGDLLSHEIDFVHSVLRLGIPDTCSSTGHNNLLHDGREVPDTWSSVFNYKKKNCTVTFDCSMNSCALIQPPEFRGKEALMRFNSIAQSVSDFDVYAEPKSEKYKEELNSGEIKQGQPFMSYDPSKTEEQPSHMQDFFNSVRSRKKVKCNEDEAFIEAATLIMAVKSFQNKKEARWDAENEEVLV